MESSAPSTEVVRLAIHGHQELRTRYPLVAALGGSLFLGREFAHPGPPRVLMLGLNPGASSASDFHTGLYASNPLLGEQPARFGYWRNAAIFFGASAFLQSAMARATFAFCCPYRTATWVGLPRALRRDLVELSTPVLREMIRACRPQFVITAGKTTCELARLMLNDWSFEPTNAECRTGNARYTCRRFEGSSASEQFTLLQIPHFSRANARARLLEGAAWLELQLRQAAA